MRPRNDDTKLAIYEFVNKLRKMEFVHLLKKYLMR